MDASSRGCLDSIHLHGKNSEANRNHLLSWYGSNLVWKVVENQIYNMIIGKQKAKDHKGNPQIIMETRLNIKENFECEKGTQ